MTMQHTGDRKGLIFLNPTPHITKEIERVLSKIYGEFSSIPYVSITWDDRWKDDNPNSIKIIKTLNLIEEIPGLLITDIKFELANVNCGELSPNRCSLKPLYGLRQNMGFNTFFTFNGDIKDIPEHMSVWRFYVCPETVTEEFLKFPELMPIKYTHTKENPDATQKKNYS